MKSSIMNVLSLCLALLLALAACFVLVEAGGMYVGYHPTWSENQNAVTGSELNLAQIATYVTHVPLAFIKPDCEYSGDWNLEDTGLNLWGPARSNGKIVRDAVRIAQAKGQVVLLSVGGATYQNWESISWECIKNLVEDLEVDGLDLDFEGGAQCSTNANGFPECNTDAAKIQLVTDARDHFPRPVIVSSVAASVGAYGWGKYLNAPPWSNSKGVEYQTLKAVGDKLDFISIMAYDAGPTYKPTDAFDAYSSIYDGPITLGVEPPPEAWGGHMLTLSEVSELTDHVVAHNGAGMMIWALIKAPHEDLEVTPTTVSQTICLIQRADDEEVNCNNPLFGHFAPPGWTCEPDRFSDGTCDCDCGHALDTIDCTVNGPKNLKVTQAKDVVKVKWGKNSNNLDQVCFDVKAKAKVDKKWKKMVSCSSSNTQNYSVEELANALGFEVEKYKETTFKVKVRAKATSNCGDDKSSWKKATAKPDF
eukprot:TRINITY_DN6508_c0_g1_i3.p1 TRINITY_DN6508_c0_g1~~TRINITY_DN6508_c0_g1_i3.p1  ORF type:complete len:477 (+),score=85.26 TRINITY_DN6508_c0_g1_i3:128-1558(+)